MTPDGGEGRGRDERTRADETAPTERLPYDLERLKWLDPCSDARFTRRELVRAPQDASNEARLENLVSLTDAIFDHLSVFEQFSETTSRGSVADPRKMVATPDVRERLAKAEEELWGALTALRGRRRAFVDAQLERLGVDERSRDLKVHIGAGAHVLPGWINIDGGGGDLAMNVNWGLPLPDGSAQYVYCAHLLEHLRYGDQAPLLVREILRVLASGATVRLVVPDIRKLLSAYVRSDGPYFAARREFYPLSPGFEDHGIASLDYILLFSGAGPQLLNYNHKFGYDFISLAKLLRAAGFRDVVESSFQSSAHAPLRVDDHGENARAKNLDNQHYSLFVEATK